MSTWMKKTITAESVTEFPTGPHLGLLEKRFGSSGAVMLLLDVSYSMDASVSSGRTRLDAARDGCAGFLREAVAGGYETGLILWSHKIEGSEPPSTDGLAALKLLGRAEPTGATELAPALELAGKMLMSRDVQDRVIAVFSDGSLGDETEAKASSVRLAQQGIRILALGLGETSAKSLSSISTEEAGAGAASAATMSDDIRGLARGLSMKRR